MSPAAKGGVPSEVDFCNRAPVTPEGIDALLEIWLVFEAFQTQFVAKGLILDAEKNVPGPLPNGPSAGATATAVPARGAAPIAPARLNRQQTEDGRQVWDLVGRPGCQLWVIPGAMLGRDMGAALVMAHALGIDTLIAAELLPWIEAVMVRKLNEQIASDDGGGFRS